MLTLRDAVALVMDPTLGKYPRTNGQPASEWSADVARYLRIAIEILGGDTPVEEIKHGHYKKLWREMSALHVADPSRFGATATEKVCVALRGAVSWLQLEEHCPVGAGLPAPRWATQMRGDWMRITGKVIKRPAKHRATKEELAKLFAALPQADPRIRMAVEIGAELRLGQVVRARRSDIYAYGSHQIGGVIIHGRGHKMGADVLFTDRQRRIVCIEMVGGYLADVERAFQAELLEDYILIAGGFHAHGKALIQNALTPISMRALRNYWMALELIADVEHVRGRGWYQLRRSMSDHAEDLCKDERVLNETGGWTDSNTRHGYQESGRPGIREKVRDLRDEMRTLVTS